MVLNARCIVLLLSKRCDCVVHPICCANPFTSLPASRGLHRPVQRGCVVTSSRPLNPPNVHHGLLLLVSLALFPLHPFLLHLASQHQGDKLRAPPRLKTTTPSQAELHPRGRWAEWCADRIARAGRSTMVTPVAYHSPMWASACHPFNRLSSPFSPSFPLWQKCRLQPQVCHLGSPHYGGVIYTCLVTRPTRRTHVFGRAWAF